MPEDDSLIAAAHAESVTALAHGLCFDERGKAHRRIVDRTAEIAAETVARHLDLSGFVVMT